MSENNNTGLGLSGVLTAIFVVLKLCKVISWSWWWVLSPLWIDLILCVLVVAGVRIYMSYDDGKFQRRKQNKWKF